MLHHMGNAWVSSLISHSTGKCSKTHCMGRTWEVGIHTFPIGWAHLMGKKHPHHGKSMSTNFPGSPDAMGFAAFSLNGESLKT